MVETKWRAVAIGLVIIAFLSVVSASVEQLALLGGAVAGIVGGWAAGYYARSGARNGAWNGFLAGSIGSLIATAALVALGLAVSIVELSLGGVFATVGLGLTVLVLIVIGAIPAILGGYIGGIYPRRETEEEVGRPAA
jgi:hypothetical protein